MQYYLTDTNVISELVRPRPDPGIVAWANGVTRVALSTISLEEIQYGLSRNPNDRVHGWVEKFLPTIAEYLPVTVEIAKAAGRMRGQLAARGVACSQADMLIASTAQVHGLTLVTRNIADFENCGVGLLNPFRH